MGLWGDIKDIASDIGDFATDIGDALVGFLKGAGREAFAEAGALAYVAAALDMRTVRNNGKPRVALPQAWKDALRPDFGGLVDDARVVYSASLMDHLTISLPGKNATIPLKSGVDGQTFGDTIYIKAAHNPADANQLTLVGHEMVHFRQWVEKGKSDHAFGKEYFKGYFDAGFSYKGNVMEKEAYAFGTCFEIRYTHGLSKFVSVGATQTPPGWTKAFQVEVANKPAIGFYNRQTGAVSLYELSVVPALALKKLWEGTWQKGITVAAPFNVGGKVHALLYNGSTGVTEFGRLPDGYAGAWISLGTEPWSKGWTVITMFVLNGRQHYIKYKEDSGSVQIERVKTDGSGREDVWQEKWTKGWTSITSFQDPDLNLFLYKANDKGLAKVVRLEANGNGIAKSRDLNWSKGWTHIVGAGAQLLLYKHKAGSGGSYRKGEFRVVRPHNVTSSDETDHDWCGAWSSEWDQVGIFKNAGKVYVFRVRLSDRSLRVDRLD